MHEVGLREALVCAKEFAEVRDPLPIVEFGLYRLLVALVMDIYRFGGPRDLEDLLATGKFGAERVDAYLEKHGSLFDLFHEEHPFLQFADMRNEPDKPLAGLLPAIPSGTNASHFYHAHEDEFAVCPEAAARLLTTVAPFMTAGGAGLSPSINGAPPWYVLIVGGSLFETLCLNCCVVHLTPQGNEGTPAWRRRGAFASERREGASLLEGLTWQPRRILLTPDKPGRCALTGRESDVTIRTIKFASGAAAGFPWTDPNVAYRFDAKKGPVVLRPQEGKQVWRDIGALALLHDETHGTGDERMKFARPRIVDQYAGLYADILSRSLVPTDLRITVYGMRTDMKMKVFEWYRESLDPLPAPLVLRQTFAERAQQEMNRAGRIDWALEHALKCAYPRDGKGNKNAFKPRIEYARRRFWTALRPDYRDYLEGLAGLDIGAEAILAHWHSRLKAAGWAALEEAIKDLDARGTTMLRTEVVARTEFGKSLQFAFNATGADGNRGRRKRA